MSKYMNKKTVIDGITFDSKAEAARYQELKLLEKAGEINQLQMQPEFVLQPGFTKKDKKYKPIKYRADFQYYDFKRHKMVVEDVKGHKTKDFILKQKIFEYVFAGLNLDLIQERSV
jgi:hypothetical protein